LSKEWFEQFILPHLSKGCRGPATTLSFRAVFDYILWVLYLGCRWKNLPIEKDQRGLREAFICSPRFNAVSSADIYPTD